MNSNIEHVHFEECESTQAILKKMLKNRSDTPNLLISSNQQTQGRGRSGKVWDSVENSIAMSFVTEPSAELTLTSLEMGALFCEFFKQETLQLKWPNDILNSNSLKCAGILCQSYKDRILVGIGLNYGRSKVIEKSQELRFGRSHITDQVISTMEVKNISNELYSYIIHNRLTEEDTTNLWNSYCCHINHSVEIRDNATITKGIFKGIGERGEALIDDKGSVKKVYTGSLFLS